MRIFADFHHSGAAQGQVLLLHSRLGHEVYFPNEEFVKRVTPLFEHEGDWLPPTPNWLERMGGTPEHFQEIAGRYIIGYDEFMAMDWDFILVTRTESQKVFKKLLEDHPYSHKIKKVAMTGNDCTSYDWDWVKNFMCCDELSYVHAPKNINKIWYDQEIGQHYGREFVPVTEQSRKTVNSFINCWPSFVHDWYWDHEFTGNHGSCPHCGSKDNSLHYGPIKPYWVYDNAMLTLESEFGYKRGEYGINGRDGMIMEKHLPSVYAGGFLTIHMKTYDGYGYSMLQSIACGRPVIVPRGFHRYRTANKFLIPNLTCFEVEWSDSSIIECVLGVSRDLETANRYAKACYEAARGLFNWDLEAYRVREFLRRLM